MVLSVVGTLRARIFELRHQLLHTRDDVTVLAHGKVPDTEGEGVEIDLASLGANISDVPRWEEIAGNAIAKEGGICCASMSNMSHRPYGWPLSCLSSTRISSRQPSPGSPGRAFFSMAYGTD